jgi:ABC-type branched-subunit amino acid transport system substrate-binding protein
MKKSYIIALVVVILILVVYFLGNKKDDNVVFGVIAGTTGQYAAAGEGYVQGFNLAIEEWNESHTSKLSAIIEDDGFDAQKGLSAYKKLKELDGVDAYAILSSFTIDAVYDQLHKEGRPVALGFEQTRSAEDDNIFQVLPAAEPVETALGQKVKDLGYKKPIAAVSNNTSVYQNFYRGFKNGFGSDVPKFEMGGDIGIIRSQALAIIDSKPDVVAFFMAPQDGALLVQEIVKLTSTSARPYFVFDQSIQSGIDNYEKIFGKNISVLNGSLVAMSKNDFTEDFANAFRKKYNIDPVFGSDMGYNSFLLLANTYDSNSSKWITNMKKTKFTGSDGELSFDAMGLRVPNIFFGKLENGKIN